MIEPVNSVDLNIDELKKFVNHILELQYKLAWSHESYSDEINVEGNGVNVSEAGIALRGIFTHARKAFNLDSALDAARLEGERQGRSEYNVINGIDSERE